MSQRKNPDASALLKAAQNQIRGSTAPRTALSRARCLVPVSEMLAFIDWIPAVRHKGRAMGFYHFPRSLEELWRSKPLDRAGLEREVAWASGMFRLHATVLNEFRIATERYEGLLIEGSYNDCKKLLDSIDQNFGISLWAIENRLALLQFSDGLEAQKVYTNQILAARSKNDVVAFLTHYLSRRNEPDTTPIRFGTHIE